MLSDLPKISLTGLRCQFVASTEPGTGLGPAILFDFLLWNEVHMLGGIGSRASSQLQPLPDFFRSFNLSLLSAPQKDTEPWMQRGCETETERTQAPAHLLEDLLVNSKGRSSRIQAEPERQVDNARTHSWSEGRNNRLKVSSDYQTWWMTNKKEKNKICT